MGEQTENYELYHERTGPVLLEPDDIVTLKEKQKTKAFLIGKNVSAIIPTGFCKTHVKHRRT